MDQQVKASLSEALAQYGGHDSNVIERMSQVFAAPADFLSKVSSMDAVIDDNPSLESLREVVFDLLLINFFSEDVKKLEEDYLESPEWAAIEEQTIDRGTELLNVFLYLRECRDEGLEPALDDFLKEFLLVEEDEFQDEHRIYEDVIANQILVEGDYSEIARVAKSLPDTTELRELFYPLMAFFSNTEAESQDLADFAKNSDDPKFDAAVLKLLLTFNKQ